MKQGHLFGKEQGTGIAKKCEGNFSSIHSMTWLGGNFSSVHSMTWLGGNFV